MFVGKHSQIIWVEKYYFIRREIETKIIDMESKLLIFCILNFCVYLSFSRLTFFLTQNHLRIFLVGSTEPQPQDSADVSLNYYYLPLTPIQIECKWGLTTNCLLQYFFYLVGFLCGILCLGTLLLSSLIFWFHP